METNIADNYDEAKLKKIIQNFQRKYNENQKLRIKHSESPAKFASSETELFVAIDELQGVATQTELYNVIISMKAIPTLISLIAHENSDISAKVIGLLQEFTDIDEVEDQEPSEALIKVLLEGRIIEALTANLSRLDESIKEESQAINNSLAIIDNLIDFDSSIATIKSESIIGWILNQMKTKLEFNSIKLSSLELLSVLLMNSNENKILLGELGGIDTLLQQVAYYRQVAPVTGDEHEFLEQVVNCLCTAILDCDKNRKSLFEEEGIDLIELILREKREAIKKSNIKLSILKLFNHVVTTDKNSDQVVTKCCERFVQVLGLKVLFPILNNPKILLNEKVKRREYLQVINEIEEHSLAILLALLKHCQNTDIIQRVLIKLAESNFSKFSKIIQLHDKYFCLVLNNCEPAGSDDDEEEETTNSSAYFTLRTIDYIILLSCYLSYFFEIYDPNGGETFDNFFRQLSLRRPELKHQIFLEVRKHINEVDSAASCQEKNSLEFLLKHFEKVTIASNVKPPNS